MDQDRLFEHIRALRVRDTRDTSGLHFIEGIRPVLQAMEAGIPIEAIVFSEILVRNPYAQKRVRIAKRSGTPVHRVTPEEFRTISRTVRASGIGAIVRQRWTPLEQINPYEGLCWIGLSRMRSPGNLGTIVRTAEAVGAGGLVFLGDAIDPFDPAVMRASLGGLFRLKLVRTTLDEFSTWSKRRSCRVLATSPSASVIYCDAPFRPPLIVLFGEERSGLTGPELSSCTHRVRIPIQGHADSLNVGVAAGIVLYDLLRRRKSSNL